MAYLDLDVQDSKWTLEYPYDGADKLPKSLKEGVCVGDAVVGDELLVLISFVSLALSDGVR